MAKLVYRLAENDEIFDEIDEDEDPDLYEEWLSRTGHGWSNGTVYARVEEDLEED